MDISEFLSIIKIVLTDKRVIGTAVIVFLCMDFGAFVAGYTKKPPKPRRVRTSAKPAPAVSSTGETKGGDESASDVNTENKTADSVSAK
jgi:hypothetical protein